MEVTTTNTAPQAEQFQEWAKVELMGHQAVAGLVTTNNPLAPLLRVDVPGADGNVLFTQFVHPQAIYRLTPVSKQIAIGLAIKMDLQPVMRYELTQLTQQDTPMLPGIEDGQLMADPEDDPYEDDHD